MYLVSSRAHSSSLVPEIKVNRSLAPCSTQGEGAEEKEGEEEGETCQANSSIHGTHLVPAATHSWEPFAFSRLGPGSNAVLLRKGCPRRYAPVLPEAWRRFLVCLVWCLL